MAGGMTVVTATGMALGGSLGAYIGNRVNKDDPEPPLVDAVYWDDILHKGD